MPATSDDVITNLWIFLWFRFLCHFFYVLTKYGPSRNTCLHTHTHTHTHTQLDDNKLLKSLHYKWSNIFHDLKLIRSWTTALSVCACMCVRACACVCLRSATTTCTEPLHGTLNQVQKHITKVGWKWFVCVYPHTL